jgi:hypothetical protein
MIEHTCVLFKTSMVSKKFTIGTLYFHVNECLLKIDVNFHCAEFFCFTYIIVHEKFYDLKDLCGKVLYDFTYKIVSKEFHYFMVSYFSMGFQDCQISWNTQWKFRIPMKMFSFWQRLWKVHWFRILVQRKFNFHVWCFLLALAPSFALL